LYNAVDPIDCPVYRGQCEDCGLSIFEMPDGTLRVKGTPPPDHLCTLSREDQEK